MKVIKQSYHINSPIEKVWQSLVEPNLINAWGGGPAKMNDKPESDFTLWGGDIWGTNKAVDPPTKLVQEWHSGKDGPATLVTFTLTEDKKGTRVDLLHEEVPDDAAQGIEDGWDKYYLGAIKHDLEQ